MLRTQLVYTGLVGMPAVNSLFWTGTGPTQAGQAAASTNDFAADLANNLAEGVTVDVDNTCVEINEATGEIVQYYSVTGGTYAGAAPFDPLPIGTSMVLGLQTNAVVRGRRLQGRLFLPGLSEDAVADQGIFQPTYVTVIDGIAADTLAGGVAVQVVWSRPTDAGGDGSSAPVSVYSSKQIPSSLPSRRR